MAVTFLHKTYSILSGTKWNKVPFSSKEACTQVLLDQIERSSPKASFMLAKPCCKCPVCIRVSSLLIFNLTGSSGNRELHLWRRKKSRCKACISNSRWYHYWKVLFNQLKILAFNVYWEETKHVTERDANPRVFPKQPFQCPSHLNRNIFQAAVLKASWLDFGVKTWTSSLLLAQPRVCWGKAVSVCMDFLICKAGMIIWTSSAECCRMAGMSQPITLEYIVFIILYVITQSAVVRYSNENLVASSKAWETGC